MRKTLSFLLVLALLMPAALAGLRGPGKYHGVVLFDRWEGCYLYSAIYLMYVPEKRKETLRTSSGKCVVLDATEVYQPMNPGDGRLEDFTLVGDSTPEPGYQREKEDQITLTASLNLNDPRHPMWRLTVWNDGPEPVDMRAEDLALTILTKKPADPKGWLLAFSPSDGPSLALVTRQSFYGADSIHWEGQRPLGEQRAAWCIREQDRTDTPFQLPAGTSREFVVELSLTPGEYDLVFGYGGGSHESLSVASNMIAVDVAATGEATVPEAHRR